jgi:hypothetical protein
MIAAAMALLCVPLLALAQEPPPAAFYQAGEFQVDLFGSVVTPDLDNYTTGAGIGVGYYVTRNIGLGAAVTGDWSEQGKLADEIEGTLLYRIPIERSAITFRGGTAWHIEEGRWTLILGPGLEHRFTRNFGIFTEALMAKRLDSGQVNALGRAGIRVAF